MAKPHSSARVITVSGNAAVRVIPDQVTLTLGVETWHTNLVAAKVENEQRLERIMAAVAVHGVSSKDVQTDYISIEPEYKASLFSPCLGPLAPWLLGPFRG